MAVRTRLISSDDNFATIVAAVEEGRVIYDNLRRFVSFAVAGNLGKIIVMLGWPIPYLIAGGEITATPRAPPTAHTPPRPAPPSSDAAAPIAAPIAAPVAVDAMLTARP